MGLELKELFIPDATRSQRPVTRPVEKPKKMYPNYAELVKVLEYQSKGTFSQEWVYTNTDGEEIFRVLRFNLANGGKTIRPVCPVNNGFVMGDPHGPLPLYHLPKLTGASRIYVVEGEKCADVAEAIGLTATTSSHGSQSARKSDWFPLAGKDVIICPDNDAPGEKYAKEVAGILSRLMPPAKVKILRLPGLESKEDIFDFIAKRKEISPDAIFQEIETLADQGGEWTPAESAENVKPMAEYQPFPTDALPRVVRDFVEQGSIAMNCDSSFITLPLLAALAAAIGNTRRIVLRRDWLEPCVLWTACVGDSGTLKSPAMDLALSALREQHGDAMRGFQEEMAAYRESKLEREREIQRWKKSKDNVPPPQDAEEPIPTRYICSDTTVEALAVMLQNQPRGILLERDELNGWLKSFGAYKGGKGGDDGHWLSVYGARSLTVDRKGDPKIIYVPRAAVSITGGIQPQILQRSLAGEHTESGLTARFLLAMPPRRRREWTEAEIDPTIKAGVGFLFKKLLELDFSQGCDDSTSPIDVTLSPAAKTAWIRFYEDHSEASYALTNPALKAAYAKIEGIAARLALVLHCVRSVAMESGVQPTLIDEQSVKMGVTLARWFRTETTRIYDILSIGDDETCDGPNSLIELIRSKGGRLTVRELSHCSRKYRDDPEGNLQGLVDQGFGKWELIPSGSTGGRPTKYFELTEAC
jgi:hypothetical protein